MRQNRRYDGSGSVSEIYARFAEIAPDNDYANELNKMKVPIAMLSRCRLAAYSRGLSSMGAARALSTHPTISPDGEAAYPEGTKQKIGPKLATDRGLAGEKGQLPRRWIDEPVPANSMSAMKEFPGLVLASKRSHANTPISAAASGRCLFLSVPSLAARHSSRWHLLPQSPLFLAVPRS